MMRVRIGLALAAIAGMAALGATACADAEATDAVELRFWAMGAEGEVVERLIPEFERRNPRIRVRVQSIPWSAAHEKLLTAHVGDATPDVSQLGNTWVPEFVALDALMPLDAMIARPGGVEPGDHFPGIWATNVLDSTVYGVPWYVDTRVLFYRSDLLRAAGYDGMPQTWAGFRAALVALKRRMGPDAWPILLPTNEWPQPVILGLQAGSPLLKDGGRYGAFSDSAFREGFSFYVSLFRDGLAPAVSAAEIANRYQEFERGNVAMMITGPWEIAEFRRRLPPALQDDWMTAPLPGPDGPGVSTAGGSSLVIFRGTAHADAAWKLVEYLSAPETQARFFELTGNLPAHRLAWRDSALAGNPYLRAFASQLERTRPLPMVPEIEQIVTKVFERGERAARGASTIEEALHALDRDVDALLEKRRWLLARDAERARAAAGGGG